MRKQSILYWFPSKEALLEALIDRSAGELADALEDVPGRAGSRVGAGRGRGAIGLPPGRAPSRAPRPACARWAGSARPAATRLMLALEPLVQRASAFLAAEMDAGHMRRHEPRLLLLAIYSTVVGMITEVEVLRALGEEPTPRSLVRRRQEILRLLRSALLVDGGDRPPARYEGGAGGRGRVGRGGV